MVIAWKNIGHDTQTGLSISVSNFKCFVAKARYILNHRLALYKQVLFTEIYLSKKKVFTPWYCFLLTLEEANIRFLSRCFYLLKFRFWGHGSTTVSQKTRTCVSPEQIDTSQIISGGRWKLCHLVAGARRRYRQHCEIIFKCPSIHYHHRFLGLPRIMTEKLIICENTHNGIIPVCINPVLIIYCEPISGVYVPIATRDHLRDWFFIHRWQHKNTWNLQSKSNKRELGLPSHHFLFKDKYLYWVTVDYIK